MNQKVVDPAERQAAIRDFVAKNNTKHHIWTWNGVSFTLADLLAFAREQSGPLILELSKRACYCDCHTPYSSRAMCVHCSPQDYVNQADPYCGVTAGDLGLLPAIPEGRVSGEAQEKAEGKSNGT